MKKLSNEERWEPPSPEFVRQVGPEVYERFRRSKRLYYLQAEIVDAAIAWFRDSDQGTPIALEKKLKQTVEDMIDFREEIDYESIIL